MISRTLVVSKARIISFSSFQSSGEKNISRPFELRKMPSVTRLRRRRWLVIVGVFLFMAVVTEVLVEYARVENLHVTVALLTHMRHVPLAAGHVITHSR